MNRREFLETVAAAAVLPALAREDVNEWGAPVFDVHFHFRPQAPANHRCYSKENQGCLLTIRRLSRATPCLLPCLPRRPI